MSCKHIINKIVGYYMDKWIAIVLSNMSMVHWPIKIIGLFHALDADTM
jgi:hypothetical protein